MNVCIIGGTGLTKISGMEIVKREVVHTPFGEPSGPFTTGRLFDKEIVFLARHGYSHNIPPHKVNYRANIWAAKKLGIENIIAFAAVGGINPSMLTTSIIIPDQIIDYTYSRSHTFFEDDLSSVTHIDFSQPYTPVLRQKLLTAADKAGIKVVNHGVYAAMQGPRLETAAEINRLERDGCDIVGMTGMPEAALAKELSINYAALAVVANPAAGRGEEAITMDGIRENINIGMQNGRKILEALLCHMM